MSSSIAYGVVLSETYGITTVDLDPEDTSADVTLHSFGDPDYPQHAVVLRSTVRRTSGAMTTGFRHITTAQHASIFAFCTRYGFSVNSKHNLGDPTWLVFAHGVG